MPPTEETPIIAFLDNLTLDGEFPISTPLYYFSTSLGYCRDYVTIRESILDDNTIKELIDLARQDDAAGFHELAACLMPIEDIQECWEGTRQRLHSSHKETPA